jgi:fused signal recognition particle receptor
MVLGARLAMTVLAIDWTTTATIAAAAIVAIALLLIVISRGRKPPPPPALPPERLPPQQRAAVEQATAALDRARRDREAAEARALEEQAGRRAKGEAAKKKAEDEAAARAEAQRRAEELRKTAAAAGTEEERRAAREAMDKATAEAARRAKEQSEAERRAAYEARKAEEAEERARRRAAEEERKVADLEAARKRAEEEAAAGAAKARRVEAESGRTLLEGLEKTRGGFMSRIARLVGASTELDDRFIGQLEEILFTADIGVRTATNLLETVREKLKRREISNPDKVKAALRTEIERILTLDGKFETGGMPPATTKPQVVMIVGVNGSGKTTTIGKLAFKERVGGRSVLLGAGDTFRAAAAEQLDVWAARAQVDIIKGPPDSDPGAVCFDTVKKSVEERRDLCLLDTAGRLHTKAPLMDELRKVKRVIDKAMPGAPQEIWLVVDGTTGQNAVVQAQQFHEALGLTGLVLTKLDGTAKGGVVIGICDELKVPVRYIGVGEKIGDLRAFSPKEFVDALFAEPAAA